MKTLDELMELIDGQGWWATTDEDQVVMLRAFAPLAKAEIERLRWMTYNQKIELESVKYDAGIGYQ